MHESHIHEYHEAHGHHGAARESERRTLAVVVITAVTMVAELVVGALSGSLALLADGFHMATHAGALGLSALAYWFARTRARDEAFTFGTGKVYALSGFTSAIVLGMVAVWMAVESVQRLLEPRAIHFAEALPVAALGLVVNLLSAKLLGGYHGHHDHDHHHHHDRPHPHGEPDEHGHDHEAHSAPVPSHHHDVNLRAAYLHVLADALTSVLAIAALVAGRWFGLVVLDPIIALVASVVILHWARGLVRDAARQLLDMAPSLRETQTLRERLEAIDDVRVADLHLWDIGPKQRGCIVKLVTAAPRDTAFYRDVIKSQVAVSHLTVEVHRCPFH